MLIPIQAARAAVAEDTSAKTQQPAVLLTASQRGEAIQKILNALTRHLAGREILPKDALVRLMEDLARILKFPPLPQEGGRDFVRRLVAFLESMPASDRLLLERQFGGRSLAGRIGVLADLPAIRNGANTPTGTATPMPAHARDVILRNPSLQPAMPFNPGTARTPVAGEVALLQAVLRKTFDVGNDSDGLEPAGDDLEQTKITEAPSKGRNERPSERSETRTPAGKLASPDGAPIDGTALLMPGDGEVEETAPQTALRPGADESTRSTEIRSEPAAHPAEAGAPADETGHLAEAGTSDGMERLETAEDPDGTDRSLPEADEDTGRKTASAAGRGNPETRPARVLFDAIKTLIRDSLALPGGAASSEARAATDITTAPLPVAAEEAASPDHGADAQVRQREAPEGNEASPSLLDDRTEEAKVAQRAPVEMRPQRPSEEQTMQQVIARLVENGLPREAIPFAMIPYPPATNDAAETEHVGYEMPGGSGEDGSGEEQDAEEGEAGDQDGTEPAGDSLHEDETPDAPDAYDLYRRLGGLG